MISAVKEVRGTSNYESKNLRSIASLSAVGVADFIPISLFQLGIIKHLPDPPGEIFNSDKVNSSDDAQLMGVPDGVISLAMYSTTIALTGVALSSTALSKPAKLMIGAITVGQALGGAYYLSNMIRVQKKVCPYCVTGALINFLTLIPAVKLLKGNVGHIKKR